MTKNKQKSYSQEQLARWGLLKQAQREEIIDTSIVKISPPNESDKDAIKSNWLSTNQIGTNEELLLWQTDHSLTYIQWEEMVIRNWLWGEWCKGKSGGPCTSLRIIRKNSKRRFKNSGTFNNARGRIMTIPSYLYFLICDCI